jgi:DNA-binding NtrC family response regulator
MNACASGKLTPEPMSLAFAGFEHEWPADFEAFVARELVGREGATVARLADVSEAPALLRSRGITALIVNAERLGLKTQVALLECRRVSPATALVVVGTSQTRGLKNALEGGATAFLCWPASAEVFRQALRSGNDASRAATTATRRRGEVDGRS